MRTAENLIHTTDDGTDLRADVYWPEQTPAPVILIRTPYTKEWFAEAGASLAAAGYIGVIQDVRGQNASDGVWEPFVHEAEDGASAVRWAARLEGSDGRVAMMGASYLGATGLKAATKQPEELVCVVAAETPADYYEHNIHPGGAFALAFIETWTTRNIANSAAARLPDAEEVQALMDETYWHSMDEAFHVTPPSSLPALFPNRRDVAPYVADWLGEHRTRTDYWDSISLRRTLDQIDVPVLGIGGWYDVFAPGTTEIHSRLAEAGKDTQLLLGPWSHNMWGRSMNSVDFGPDADFDETAESLAWIDRQMGRSRPGATAPVTGTSEPSVRYFTTGDNEWHTADHWPPEHACPTNFYLGVDGSLTGEAGEVGTACFTYNPKDPTPAYGGHSCCYQPQAPMGPMDQRVMEARSDVVSFTMPAADEAWTFAGPVEAVISFSADTADTDVVVMLTDVDPNGASINLAEGIQRVSHRDSDRYPQPLSPGKRTELTVRLQPRAHTVLPGHRLRVNVTGSLFPTYERNLNTGRQDLPIEESVVSHHVLHLGGEAGSRLVLHVCE